MAPLIRKERPLLALAEAFGTLAWEFEKGGSEDLKLKSYVVACSKISDLLGQLGLAFKFAQKDFTFKIDELFEASKQHDTMRSLLDSGAHYGSRAAATGPIRSALYVNRAASMLIVLFRHILDSRYSLRECASKAYEEVFASYHDWAVRKAVKAGMYSLPSMAQFMRKINEDEASAWTQMQAYLSTAIPVNSGHTICTQLILVKRD